MIFPVFRLPVSCPSANREVIPSEYLSPIGPAAAEPAQDVYEHWTFFNGEASLRGLRYGRILTPQSTEYTFSDKYVTLPGTGNALLTDVPDDEEPKTMMLAVRLPTASQYYGPIMAGAWAGDSPDRTGSALYIETNLSQLTVVVEGAIGGYVGRTYPVGATAGAWVIIGLSEDLGTYPGGRQLTFVRNAGNGPPGWSSYAGDSGIVAAKSVNPANKIAVGNAYLPLLNVNPTEVAQFAIWKKYLTGDELTAAGEVFAKNMEFAGLTVL